MTTSCPLKDTVDNSQQEVTFAMIEISVSSGSICNNNPSYSGCADSTSDSDVKIQLVCRNTGAWARWPVLRFVQKHEHVDPSWTLGPEAWARWPVNRCNWSTSCIPGGCWWFWCLPHFPAMFCLLYQRKLFAGQHEILFSNSCSTMSASEHLSSAPCRHSKPRRHLLWWPAMCGL